MDVKMTSWPRGELLPGRARPRGHRGCAGVSRSYGPAGFRRPSVNSHRRRGWVVPPRFRPGYLADRRPGPSRGKRACSAL